MCLVNLPYSSAILEGFYHLAVIHNFHYKYLLYMEKPESNNSQQSFCVRKATMFLTWDEDRPDL